MPSATYTAMVDNLLTAAEPSLRWKVRTAVLGEAPDSPEIVELREEIRGSERVRLLLAPCLAADRPAPTLGLTDGRCDDLVERLLHWQWPDGGWNCDKNPAADTSSFCETLLPMRGPAAYATAESAGAARRAAEVLLTRRLAFRLSTGELIHREFAKPHYPLYWHYDVLGGLKGVADLGLLGDERCTDALDPLESLRVPDGWPAHARYYRTSMAVALHHDSVDWGGTSARRANQGSPRTPSRCCVPPAASVSDRLSGADVRRQVLAGEG